MIKSGASPSAARAAKAHTGALVGEDRVFDAVLRECGVIRVTSVEALVDVALMFADVFPGKMPHGSGVGHRHVRRRQRRARPRTRAQEYG